MAFGIGINTEHPEHDVKSGTYREVAVKCWFTASGKSMPLMMKIKTDEDEIVKIENIRVLTSDKQWYAGILNVRYRCQALVHGQVIEFALLFCPEECSWKLLI